MKIENWRLLPLTVTQQPGTFRNWLALNLNQESGEQPKQLISQRHCPLAISAQRVDA